MVFYYSMLGLSLALVIIYAFIFHKHFDANLTIMTVLVPVINLAFVLMGNSTTVEGALNALKFTYIGGCYVLVAAMFLIFNTCGIPLKPWIRTLIIAISTGVYVCATTIGQTDIFYQGMPSIAYYGEAAYITDKHYGPMHTVFYVMIGLFYAVTIGVIIYSFFKKKQVSKTILILIVIAISTSVIGFFGSRLITKEMELLPATYNMGMIIYMVIASRLRLYDASDSVIDSLVQKGETGFISFDNKMRYLGSNETAKEMLPELNVLVVDHRVDNSQWLKENLLPWVAEFENDETKNTRLFERENKTYLVYINRLSVGSMHRGYQFLMTDDTANQQYIKLIKQYNNQLEEEVNKKTKSVIEMQEKLVVGMATMVEGRDNSTGGHIKRTSDCIRIIVGEIKKDNTLNLSDTFCNNLIKAAPMHDLGKIAVDDAILRKPGKFTPEEFEIMKTHASEGARIVKQILEGTDDIDFMNIAVNVAHYHHERWDGSGYPNKLKGESIPFEARIMAIADVYDALVSKRVYKESMSFEEANKIIMEGMGKHFDPSLKKFYVASRKKLEDYYSNLQNV
ncbi:MAG: HD domain-containing protein [Bacilli bacterium]|nr:HD domain-containing protein [Bacilli bacterium]